jgi:hypothetical protein
LSAIAAQLDLCSPPKDLTNSEFIIGYFCDLYRLEPGSGELLPPVAPVASLASQLFFQLHQKYITINVSGFAEKEWKHLAGRSTKTTVATLFRVFQSLSARYPTL